MAVVAALIAGISVTFLVDSNFNPEGTTLQCASDYAYHSLEMIMSQN